MAALTPGGSSEAERLFDAGDYRAALQSYEALARIQPSPRLSVNVGYCRLLLEDIAGAAASFQAALSADPRLAQAWVGLGDVHAMQNEHARALDCYDGALREDPQLAVARNNRAQSLAALGRQAESWRDGEARLALSNAQSLYPHLLALPRWDGSSGKRVIVHWEGGYGDIIQHARFLPLLKVRCARVVFECPPPLHALFVRSFPEVPVLAARNLPPDTHGYDCAVSLLSLPFVLQADAHNLPPAPYLRSDPQRAAPAPGRIGIAWRASAFDPARSLPLEELLGTIGAAAFSLQHAPDKTEKSLLERRGIADAGSALRDFDDTAAALAGLDLLITVDTAIAHLAGAMGIPVWLLLNEPAATRWMLQRADSPWYAGMRIFRKPRSAPWSGLLEQVAAALRERESRS